MDAMIPTPKKMTSTHIFDESISRVSPCFVDFVKNNTIFTDISSPIEMVIGNNSFTVGNEFNLVWYGFAKLNWKCTEYINTSNHVRISWKIYAADFDNQYDMIYNFYTDTVGKQTLLSGTKFMKTLKNVQ